MKKQFFLIVAFFALMLSAVYAQDKSKESREDKKMEAHSRNDAMVTSKTFEFVGITAFPLGLSPVDLGSNTNSMTITPDLIQSDMPYYGTGYSGMAMGRDKGMRFSGKPENFNVSKGEKEYEVNMTVKGETDSYSITLLIGFEGSATLSISSNNRGTISYQGEIRKIKD